MSTKVGSLENETGFSWHHKKGQRNSYYQRNKIRQIGQNLGKEINKYEKITESNGETCRKNLTPVKAIRKLCIECVGSQKAPRYCTNQECPLFVFRLGKNPGRAGIGGKRKSERFR